MHHKDDVEDNEEVVCVPEDLIVGQPERTVKMNEYMIIFKETLYLLIL